MRGVLLPAGDGIQALRAALARDHTLFEVRGDGAAAGWVAVDPGMPFVWPEARPLVSGKRFFFAPREELLKWAPDEITAVDPVPEPIALFGVQSCDLTAIAYQDRFFADDPWYQRRRAAAFLVGLDCERACPGGFCRDVDAGPFARTGFDLTLTALPEGRVLVTAGSDAGTHLLEAAGLRLQPADGATRAAYDAARARAEATFPARPEVRRTIERIDARTVPDAEWHELGPSCFACTGCTNLCPTCSCFTTVDEGGPDRGTRVRLWDSCLLDGFQREASGHNPSPHPGDRVRRFWTHKLAATFVVDCGRLGCVGCGRCDVTCPGSIGALRVMGRLGVE
ncbi:MAG: 4Fe-4S dicluster domain-containing protein [Candidatus Binatia bacterium]